MVAKRKTPFPSTTGSDDVGSAPEGEEAAPTSPLGLPGPMPELPGGGEAIAMSMSGFAWPEELVGEALLHPLSKQGTNGFRRSPRRPPREKDVEIPQEYGNKYLLLFQKE